uniref:NADH-ubiquinone oxidoreductase chain 6 n=1 Tax=Amolops larutensis TaxID=325560 RepID=D7UPU6_9NEOB|nr:NADH dehydrogenase subunit 6 [Amolops larutensis]
MMMEFCLLMGLLVVASNPSPYYAALGLVVGAGASCFILVNEGLSFLPLTLFLVYLGGMMVVFAYSAALVAEPYPEAWGSHMPVVYLAVCGVLLVGGGVVGVGEILVVEVGWEAIGGEWWGVGNLLCSGGWLLFLGGWALLLTLFVVLEVVRGYKWEGVLRAV